MLTTGLQHNGASVVRYPRSSIPEQGNTLSKNIDTIEIGRGVVRRDGSKIAILIFGPFLDSALSAAKEVDASVVDMRFVSPLDEELILSISKQHKILVTIEENVISGGAGSAVNELLQRNNITIPTLTLGIPNYFVEQGEREALLAQYRLDRDGILNSILDYNSRISNN